jgi:hypothetical protein
LKRRKKTGSDVFTRNQEWRIKMTIDTPADIAQGKLLKTLEALKGTGEKVPTSANMQELKRLVIQLVDAVGDLERAT